MPRPVQGFNLGSWYEIKNIRPSLDMVIEYLKGGKQLAPGVTFEAHSQLNMSVSLDGETINVTFEEPHPQIKTPIGLKPKILGAVITKNSVTLKVTQFPDPTLKVVS
jgi:hypothetical protein